MTSTHLPNPSRSQPWSKTKPARANDPASSDHQNKPTARPPSVISNARSLAEKYHQGQKRKGDGQPFMVHPVAVAQILEQHGFLDETIAAGYCHDLLEDTDCPESEIAEKCGHKVLEIVQTVSHPPGLSWAEKRQVYLKQIKAGSNEARAVCCADKIHNLQSLLAAYQKSGDKLWSKFNASKEDKLQFMQQVLAVLHQTWHHPLVTELEELVKQMQKIVTSPPPSQGMTPAQLEAIDDIEQLMLENLRQASLEAEKDPVYQALTKTFDEVDREERAKGIGSGIYIKGRDIYLDEQSS